MKKMLTNWCAALDAEIGDTTAEILKRRQRNIEAVNMRDDLIALIEYLDRTELPAPVKRAIEKSLLWNPFCKA